MVPRIVLFLALLLSAGCASRVPVAINHPLTTQKKAKAAHHWDVLADDIASQTQAATRAPDSLLHDRPLYIQPRGNSAFDTAFRNFLITRLVNRGLSVTSDPQEGVAVAYEIQLLRHDSSRYTHLPGTLSSLATGIWVIRGIVGSAAAAAPTTLGLAGLADYALGQYAGGATHIELIVTTSIMNESQYLLRKSDIYYIEDEDTDLFSEPMSMDRPVKQLGVVGR